MDLSDVFSWVARLWTWGERHQRWSVLDTYQHTWRQHDPVVPWTWITWWRGSLSGFSTNSYYFLFSTHSLIRRESFLLLLILLAPPYSLWDLSSLSRDFYFGSWWTIGFLQQGALECWRRDELRPHLSGSNVFLKLNKLRPISFHPQTPAPGERHPPLGASLVLSPLGLLSGWVNNSIILLK